MTTLKTLSVKLLIIRFNFSLILQGRWYIRNNEENGGVEGMGKRAGDQGGPKFLKMCLIYPVLQAAPIHQIFDYIMFPGFSNLIFTFYKTNQK